MNARPSSRWWPRLRGLAAATFAFGLAAEPLAGVAAALLYVLVAPPRRGYRDIGALVWVGSFGGLSLLLAPHRLDATLPWLGWITLGTGLVMLARRWSASDTAAAALGFALAAVATLSWELRQRIFLGQSRPEGFTTHPNLEGGLLLVVLGGVAVGWPRLRVGAARGGLVVSFIAALAALALTASRGAALGGAVGASLLFGIYLGRFSWRRLLPWALGVFVLAGFGLVLLQATRGSGSRNELIGSGFSWADVTWYVGGGTGIVALEPAAVPPAGRAARLAHASPSWEELLGYRPRIAVEPGERFTLSLWARPAGHALASAFVRVEALRADGSIMAQAGRTSWAKDNAGIAGGRLVLPTGPTGVWRRVVFTLPPIPGGASSLKLAIVDDSHNTGTYGEVTAIQLEKGSSLTPYVPGPRPGLRALAGPTLTHWLALRDPTQASGGRLSMWWFGLQLASYRPVLGYGPGSELRLVRQYALDYVPRPLTHLHSFYLKMLVEGGSVTLAALLAWLGLTAWRLFVRARSGSAAAAIALATMVALLVHSAFDPVLSQPYIAGSMWLVVCSGLYSEDRGVGDEPS